MFLDNPTSFFKLLGGSSQLVSGSDQPQLDYKPFIHSHLEGGPIQPYPYRTETNHGFSPTDPGFPGCPGLQAPITFFQGRFLAEKLPFENSHEQK